MRTVSAPISSMGKRTACVHVFVSAHVHGMVHNEFIQNFDPHAWHVLQPNTFEKSTVFFHVTITKSFCRGIELNSWLNFAPCMSNEKYRFCLYFDKDKWNYKKNNTNTAHEPTRMFLRWQKTEKKT